ncbi:hypothetical protein [Actinocatenispora rupis]|uniref:Uncharacterized protein n=1 Tax=Actinocatenispora rupis TaxID=519421 RepID=A0A8J3JBQ7_9ACTN|nr:hypothetical protein [Actinocatenispora rupis]GID13078.1 hypothetical protein Aru02nite_39670 [Actinocatenispora rupis]
METEKRISLMRNRWEELEAELSAHQAVMNKIWDDPEFTAARAAADEAHRKYESFAEGWRAEYEKYKAAQVAAKRAGDAYRAALASYSLVS